MGLFLTSIHRYKFPKFQPSRATWVISISNSFDLFSYGLESVFWYFQLQRLISDISANPLKLHKISCRDPQISSIRDICLPFSKKMEISPFWCEWDLISKRYSYEKNQQQQKKYKNKKTTSIKRVKKRQKSSLAFL